MPPDPKWIPKAWRPAYSFAAVAFAILSAGATALAVVHVEAARVVDAKWNDTLRREVTEIASAAAVQASRDAVVKVTTEQIAPLKERLDRHEPADNASNARLEATVALCCPIAARNAGAAAASGYVPVYAPPPYVPR